MISGKHPGTQDAWASSREDEMKAVKAKAETQTPLTGQLWTLSCRLSQPLRRAEGLSADTD